MFDHSGGAIVTGAKIGGPKQVLADSIANHYVSYAELMLSYIAN